ncbi:hypothetical protein HanRHA438_Chr15g0688561 [Helianthus annuus]|nr:hypothetical protein HanRHA438_Chr15g0688561 [Helianthus annuus]
MFTNQFCKPSSVCVCSWTECSLSLGTVCVHLSILNTLHGYIYTQHWLSCPKDPIDDRRIIYRCQSHRRIHTYFEGLYILRSPTVSFVTYLSRSSKDRSNPSMDQSSTQNIRQPFNNCLAKSNRRMVDLVKLTRLTGTSFYIVIEHRQSTDTSAPTISNKFGGGIQSPTKYQELYKDVTLECLLCYFYFLYYI